MGLLKRVMSVVLVVGVWVPFGLSGAHAAENLKPFVLAASVKGDFTAQVANTRTALAAAGFEELGSYNPYADTFVDKTEVIVVTHPVLKQVAARSEYGAFAAPWRVAVTQVGDEVQVSYANPPYIANAYRLADDLDEVREALKQALGAAESFGSEKGLSAKKLRKYHYTFGMEYFDDVYRLAEYASHQEGVDTLEKNFAAGVAGITEVYRLDLPGEVTVFGVARKAPDKDSLAMDDKHIMEVVDFGPLKGTAYLPYEILVDGKRAVALHMRFRMAVHYPDLKMMGKHSFMNLMSSPNAIKKALTAAAGGKVTAESFEP